MQYLQLRPRLSVNQGTGNYECLGGETAAKPSDKICENYDFVLVNKENAL